MICNTCENDLAKCTCPDLEERFKRIMESRYLYIGPEYQCRILAHIEEQKKAQQCLSNPETLTE